MPRYRGTTEGAAALVGRLLLLVAAGKETSATLAARLNLSDRQVNRYILQLNQAGWHVERRGVPTRGDYFFELVAPQIIFGEEGPPSTQADEPREPPGARGSPARAGGGRGSRKGG